MDTFFDIQNNQVILNPHILNIPELRKVYDKYGLIAINYIYYMRHPKSPYRDYDSDMQSEKVTEDYKGDYDVNDLLIIEAMDKVEEMYTTPVLRFFDGLKAMLDRVSAYLKDTELDDSYQEGNFDKVLKTFEKADKLRLAYQAAEKAKDEELKARGNQRTAYDDD